MTKDEAYSKIRYSLATEEAQIITPDGEIYESFVEKMAEKLLASVIEPVKVTVTSACAKEGDFSKYQNSVVWGIAVSETSWLLTLEAKRDFALGFGSDPTNIIMHGFSSSDALGEWCA